MEKTNTYIIPTLNNYKGLYRLLETLKKHTPDNYYVYVINNGNILPKTQEDLDYIAKSKPFVHLWIDPQRNLGFGKSMNIGIKLVQTEYVTCANDDVEIMYSGWWDEVMEVFAEDKKTMGFNPHSPCNKMHTGDRCIQYDYKEEYDTEDITKIKEIFKGERMYTGCCTYFTIFKKQLFDEIGLFDESFGAGSGEDYDLMIRAIRGGYYVRGGSRVVVWHWWGATKDNMPKEVLGGISNYDLIAGGNQNLERKWGKHIDKDPDGWSVSGAGGPDEPFDKDQVNYKDKKWWQEMPL